MLHGLLLLLFSRQFRPFVRTIRNFKILSAVRLQICFVKTTQNRLTVALCAFYCYRIKTLDWMTFNSDFKVKVRKIRVFQTSTQHFYIMLL